MSKSTSVTRELRFQQWVQQVQEFNARPSGMSMATWCKQQGIAPSTFSTRLHKVQDRCLENIQLPTSANLSNDNSYVAEPVSTTFVELPVTTYSQTASSVAVISCTNFKIEISESATEDFLSKLIGAINHA